MDTKMVKEQIEENVMILRQQEKKQKKTYNRLSNVRLVVFLKGIIIGIFYYQGQRLEDAYLLLALIFLLFIYFVGKHRKVSASLKQIGYKIIVNQQYLDRMSGKWTEFLDDGEDFVDSKHPYTGDLDIFGPKSLFQWLTVAHTFYGREILQKYLSNPAKEKKEIKRRQQAVAELSGQLDFCQEMQCAGMSFPKVSHDPERLFLYTENFRKIINKQWIIYSCQGLPILTMGFILICSFTSSVSLYIPAALFLLQILLTTVGYMKIAPVLDEIYKIKDDISVFSSLLQVIETQSFTDEYLLHLQSNLSSHQQSAFEQVKKLERIIDFIDVRYSSILYFVLNVCFLWDYYCLFAVENWKGANGKVIRSWVETIGTFEALSSLALVRQLNPHWSFPSFTEGELKFVAEELGHPLLVEDKRICNDVEIDNDLGVITGSNMSGKTTLLRTVGINLVLAYAGTGTCAKELECSIMEIFTSMRVADDVNSGISTFYAELLRIKMIVDYSQQQKNMIFLIDEIFRGTNSRDRIIGARNVIKNLHKKWIIGLISTHDLELCDLEYEKNITSKNYHFEESFVGDEMKFDYRLRLGRSTTTNAQYLMKMVGIELVE